MVRRQSIVMVTLRCAAALIAMLAAAGCNKRVPTTVGNGPPAPRMIELAPAGTMGGGGGRGTVFLNFPAPDRGLTVSLRSSHPAVSVQPSRIKVPGGGMSADFLYTTRTVNRDTTFEIVASTADGSNLARLEVWALLPTFFSYSADKGTMIAGNITDRELAGRYTPANARFNVSCRDGEVLATVSPFPLSGASWIVRFGPPRGSPQSLPFTPGFYPAGTVTPPAGNRMQVELNPATRCVSGGHFTVREAQFTTEGRIATFWATFERTCAGSPGVMRGDLRISDLPEKVSAFRECAQLRP